MKRSQSLASMTKTSDQIWAACLTVIQEDVPEQSFKTWFEPIKPVKVENNVLTIMVPSQFFYEWLEEHYVPLLRKAIRKELGPEARLEYQIVMRNNYAGKEQLLSVNTPNNTNATEKETNSNDFVDDANSMGNIKNPFIIPGIRKANIDSQLNTKYTFDNFVEGACNALAKNASIAVANKPGSNPFNPLVIYGGVGLGKTHLVQAIGNHVKNKFKTKTLLYVSSEKFTNQFIQAVKSGSINDFIQFYQLIDVLIVDDIQFFANKDRTQEIFFHTFNNLHQKGKQIILTSDRVPKDLEGMEERLISRFKWGLTTDLGAPAYETRMAILEQKMHDDGITLSKEVVEYIAYNINSSVRELEGVLISVIAQASLLRHEVNLALVRRIIKNFSTSATKEVTIEFIQQKVSEHLGIDVIMIKGKSRKRQIVQARQICMYLVKKFTEKSLKQIGKAFGGRDHSTVIHSHQTVINLMETDNSFQETVLEIQRELQLNT